MKLTHLSVEDQALVLAFVDIARAECVDRRWADIEPILAACWKQTHRGTSQLNWEDISQYIRFSCDRDAA
jgi:hypothetical protein